MPELNEIAQALATLDVTADKLALEIIQIVEDVGLPNTTAGR